MGYTVYIFFTYFLFRQRLWSAPHTCHYRDNEYHGVSNHGNSTFFQQPFQANNKEKINAPFYWLLVRRIHRWIPLAKVGKFKLLRLLYHRGWTPFYFMYDPKCTTTFPLCTINAPVAFAWCTIKAPAAFAWCTNHFSHKVEFSYIVWNGVHMMTSSNGNIFRVIGHLCGEFTGPRWIPRTKASDAELWYFLWSASE